METLTFRQARTEDIPRILEIIRQAQRRMKARGSGQWQDGYPARENIAADIARGAGYVMCDNNRILAYGAVIFDGEPAYAGIDGAWPDEEPYAVVHRLAVAEEVTGRGVGSRFLQKAEALACAKGITRMRIDTNFDNGPMLHILNRLGYVRCGEIRYRNDSRQAFWKRLD